MSRVSNMIDGMEAANACKLEQKTGKIISSYGDYDFTAVLDNAIQQHKDSFKKQGKEVVDHPKHYAGRNGFEAIDVIDAFNLNFNLGSAIKYILRLGKKDDEVTELEKAIWYLQHELQNIKLRHEHKQVV